MRGLIDSVETVYTYFLYILSMNYMCTLVFECRKVFKCMSDGCWGPVGPHRVTDLQTDGITHR